MASKSSNWIWAALVAVVVVAGVMVAVALRPSAPVAPAAIETAGPADPSGELTYTRLDRPARTQVQDAAGRVLAMFTDKSRTVRISGPERTFREPRFTQATVTTDAWIRLAPKPWAEGAEQAAWFRPWLTKQVQDTSPDALAIAMDYLDGAPARKDAKGVQYAGDASFGPLAPNDPDGRAENSDFYDYMGVSWDFPDGKHERPDKAHLRSLDCSGFIRMVYGYRMKYPLLGKNIKGPGLPRRAYAMAELGPGTLLIPNTSKPARDYDLLQEGDLVFFSHGEEAGPTIQHSGIFIGVDDSGHHRFMSSRVKADGPTFGDFGGESLLDGPSYWSNRFLTARRI
ncbi:NlpC/P60 family protein [Micromonospora narathiwatensis]|uniref:NlpC/P60 family protein n=1 Tax=Micromonospora narathiwatensis TaxID=299146 RepID=A0A1A8ZU66_9ACTN|nr:NlpC/P60 family protein [Micromonospora narathiwatensis]SBT47666.1 NlpC/P60 family protein [Micromonospora narathiwatensis]